MNVINPTLTIRPETLPDAVVGLPYEQFLTPSGGDPTSEYVNFTVTGLPNGLIWNEGERRISGIATTAGTNIPILAKVYNRLGEVGFRNY